MIIGDKDRFAIEFELDAEKLADPRLGEWMYGRIRWWCGGAEVGRYEADTTIRDVSIEAERFLAHEGKRRDERLMTASSHEIVHTLVEALYEDRGQSDEQLRADEARYRPFVIRPLVDVFDPWDVFLVEGETSARLIWRRADEGEPHECALVPGEFDAALRAFVAAVRTPREASRG